MLQIIILFLCFSTSLVQTNELSCNFIQHIDGYNCEITNFFKEKITSVKGHHFSNKTNADIEVIFSPLRSNVSDFPAGACLQFENLLKFDINGQYVTELSRSIFNGCKNVQKVNVMYTKIKEFEENLFYDLVSLEALIISENTLEHLQKDLLKYNKKLRTLDLSYNKLTSISTIFPSSVTIIKLFNNPCVDRSFYPYDFNKIHETCPDENKRLSLNLTDAMSKFQELHLLILKSSAKLDDFETIADSALNELDDRLNVVEKQYELSGAKSTNLESEILEKSKSIELVKKDLKNLSLKIDKENAEIENLKEQYTANFERVKDQINKLQQHLNNFANDRIKFDNILEKSALESSFGTERKFIYIGFALNVFMFMVFMLLAFVKMHRPSKREAMLLNPFEN